MLLLVKKLHSSFLFAVKINNVKLPFTFNTLTCISQRIIPASKVPSLFHTSASFSDHRNERTRNQALKMEVPGVPLPTIVQILESFAPTSLAEKWDNVGLLVAPASQVDIGLISKVLLTNDLTEDVLQEASNENVNMIVSYHPPIFEAMKRITSSTWKGRIVQTCLRRDIAVYSPHTSWDAVNGGVNDWLLAAFGPFQPEAKPIQQSFEPNKLATHSAETVVPKEISHYLTSKIKETLSVASIGEIPYHTGNDNVVKITILCKTKDFVPLTVLCQDYPLTFSKLEETPILNHGTGRLCYLGLPQKLDILVNVIKEHLGIPDVSLALARGANMETLVRSVAVCAGSGGHVLQGQQVDLLLTGEMSHHQVLDAVHQGVNVVLTRHSNSERGFLKHFVSSFLNKHLQGKVNVIVSSKDRDPLQTA